MFRGEADGVAQDVFHRAAEQFAIAAQFERVADVEVKGHAAGLRFDRGVGDYVGEKLAQGDRAQITALRIVFGAGDLQQFGNESAGAGWSLF